MPIHLTKCDVCPTQFRVKKLNKPYVGMYKDKPVFHWNYVCPVCHHIHTVRFYNQFVNSYFDKVMNLEFSLMLNRKDEEIHKQLLSEYETVNRELELVTKDMKKGLHLLQPL